METTQALAALAALAHDSRLRVYRALVQAGPQGLSAGQIAAEAGTAPSSLSFHLKELLHADLVQSRPDGRYVIYSARFDTMHALIDYLSENCCGGIGCTPPQAVVCDTPPSCPTPTPSESTPS